MSDGLTASIEKMRRDGVADAAVDTFRFYYEKLVAGETGILVEDELEPVRDVPGFDVLPQDAPPEVLDQAAVIKLNGGLGTSMGMSGPKSLVEVKDGLTFLDLIVRQILDLRERTGARLPLVLMNSFRTRDTSLAALARYPELASDVAPDFVQNKEPKIREDDLTPVEWPDDPAQEWTPPGHGDVYTALLASGTLEQLLDRGYRYAFLSNSDNLGAVFEPRVLAWFAAVGAPFLMEVTERTDADKKGGHVARRRGGGLVLRETAQTRDEDMAAFQDVNVHRFFNTNNLWVDLQALDRVLRERGGVLGLPMIVNRKTVDPTDRSSPAVFQLETAMGAAIDVFEGSRALAVPRTRFLPVKTTSDLLVLRSDAYALSDGGRLALVPERDVAPLAELDDEHFKLLDDFEAHFPQGPPSLRDCDRLTVRGDVVFGAGVVCRGIVEVEGPRRIEDGAVLGS